MSVLLVGLNKLVTSSMQFAKWIYASCMVMPDSQSAFSLGVVIAPFLKFPDLRRRPV